VFAGEAIGSCVAPAGAGLPHPVKPKDAPANAISAATRRGGTVHFMPRFATLRLFAFDKPVVAFRQGLVVAGIVGNRDLQGGVPQPQSEPQGVNQPDVDAEQDGTAEQPPV